MKKQFGQKLQGRARITNGADLLPTVDGRSIWARIMRDTMGDMFSHLGGEDNMTAPSRMLSRRVGAFEAELIHLEDKFARARAEGREPEHADLDLYSRMSSAQRRMFEALGLERRQRDITPSLDAYITAKYSKADAELEPEEVVE